jgi:hypothetical protein
MGITQIVPGIVVDTTELLGDDLLTPMVSETIRLLQRTRIGTEFLAKFQPQVGGVNGGEKYPGATLVIRAPSEVKRTAMQSVAETGQLAYKKDNGELVRVHHLQKGSKYPARIDMFAPGARIPDNNANAKLRGVGISTGGDFMYYDTMENLEKVLIHELIHAYYFVIGEPEMTTDQDDEKRAVGIYQFKGNAYSENRLRGALGWVIRKGYPRLSVADDPDLKDDPWQFGPPDPAINVVWPEGMDAILIPGQATLPYESQLKAQAEDGGHGELRFRSELSEAAQKAGTEALRVVILGPRESWGGDMTWWTARQVWKLNQQGYRLGISRVFFEHGTKHVRFYGRG